MNSHPNISLIVNQNFSIRNEILKFVIKLPDVVVSSW